METTTISCPKCGGSGYLPRFAHRWQGECLRCKGSGRIRARVRADGTLVGHTHMLYPINGRFSTACRCGKEPPW